MTKTMSGGSAPRSKGVLLRFFTQENRRHGALLDYEWLLEQAKKLGIHGGTAYRGIAGYGRHGLLHEQHFFELAGELPVQIVFVVSADEAQRLLELLNHEQLSLFYTLSETEFGVTTGPVLKP